jgi:hypothetical protein
VIFGVAAAGAVALVHGLGFVVIMMSFRITDQFIETGEKSIAFVLVKISAHFIRLNDMVDLNCAVISNPRPDGVRNLSLLF